MPDGACSCARCREVWETGETQRLAVDLENALARARSSWPAARRPEPTAADDAAPPVYRRSWLEAAADES